MNNWEKAEKILEKWEEIEGESMRDGHKYTMVRLITEELNKTFPSQPPGEGERESVIEAWGVIANAGGGDWATQTIDWCVAAAAWRDRWLTPAPPWRRSGRVEMKIKEE